jgi:hypothetical protein
MAASFPRDLSIRGKETPRRTRWATRTSLMLCLRVSDGSLILRTLCWYIIDCVASLESGYQPEGRQIAGDVLICSSYSQDWGPELIPLHISLSRDLRATAQCSLPPHPPTRAVKAKEENCWYLGMPCNHREELLICPA